MLYNKFAALKASCQVLGIVRRCLNWSFRGSALLFLYLSIELVDTLTDYLSLCFSRCGTDCIKFHFRNCVITEF